MDLFKVKKTSLGYKVNIKPNAYDYKFWHEYGHTRMSYRYNKDFVIIPQTGQYYDNGRIEWFNLFLNEEKEIEIDREEIYSEYKTIYFHCI